MILPGYKTIHGESYPKCSWKRLSAFTLEIFAKMFKPNLEVGLDPGGRHLVLEEAGLAPGLLQLGGREKIFNNTVQTKPEGRPRPGLPPSGP